MTHPNNHYDLIVIGAGHSGASAALAAARLGVRVLLIEKNRMLGGIATHSGENVWQAGVGGTGIPFEIYRRMRKIPDGVGICRIGRSFTAEEEANWPDSLDVVDYPGVERVIDDRLSYLDTLRRHHDAGQESDLEFAKRSWHCVPFEPKVFDIVVTELLAESGNCTIVRGCGFTEIDGEKGKRMRAVQLEDGSIYTADYWVDGTDGRLCSANECRYLRGAEAKDMFNEPSAPDEAVDPTEASADVGLVFRISRRDHASIDELPDDIPTDCWWTTNFPPISSIEYPNGDRSCDMRPAMEGRQFMRMAPALAYTECHRRAKSYWHFLQTRFEEFQQFRITWYASSLGVRDTQRTITERVLNENDLVNGLAKQEDPDIIAIADNAIEIGVGSNRKRVELDGPYGIPYRCMIPTGFRNMLIASRSAGFSRIASTSCRLPRNIAQIGQAAGTAVAIAKEEGLDLPDVPADVLRDELRKQNVLLQWPMPDDLKQYLAEEQ